MSNLARQLNRRQIVETDQRGKQVVTHAPQKHGVTSFERLLGFISLVGFVFITCIIISTFASTYMVNREIQLLESSIYQQETVNEALSIQVTELSTPDRIVNIATEKLGMTLNDQNVKVVQN